MKMFPEDSTYFLGKSLYFWFGLILVGSGIVQALQNGRPILLLPYLVAGVAFIYVYNRSKKSKNLHTLNNMKKIMGIIFVLLIGCLFFLH